MNLMKIIYETNDIYKLLDMYDNFTYFHSYDELEKKYVCDYIVQRIIYFLCKYGKLNCKNINFSKLSDDDLFRIHNFQNLYNYVNSMNEPMEIVRMNISCNDSKYQDNDLFFPFFMKKFNDIISEYNINNLVNLYEEIYKLNSIIIHCYLNLIYEQFLNYIYLMDVNQLNNFYTNNIQRNDSIFHKVKIYYDKLVWICYYLIFIYLTNDLHQLCLLYHDFCNHESFKIFSPTVLINTKIRIIKKIIFILYNMSFEEIKKFRIYIINNHDNYFKLLLKNYNRIFFHIYLLAHFYNPTITNLQKSVSLEKLKKIDIPVPYHDILHFIKKIEHDMIVQNQIDSINEFCMDY